jgi:hypothetical protein
MNMYDEPQIAETRSSDGRYERLTAQTLLHVLEPSLRVAEIHRQTSRGGRGMATLEIWSYGITEPTVDLTHFKVEARDGSIGKVDEATTEAAGSFIVVDTGPWIFGKKVMLPAGVITKIDLDTETVFVNLTKDEIKNAPEFDEDTFRDQAYRNRIGDYYYGRQLQR